MTIRIGNHIIRDDATADNNNNNNNRHRDRVPTAFIRTNKDRSGNNNHICPDCMRRAVNSRIVKMIYNKEVQAFVCPVCWGTRTVNPLNRNEMQPGTANPIDAIPSLDGLSEQDAIAKDLGKPRSKPIVRSIGNAHKRSQYSSQSAFYTDNPLGADRETLEQAERMNGVVTDYKEWIPTDDNTFTTSSNELRKKNRLEV